MYNPEFEIKSVKEAIWRVRLMLENDQFNKAANLMKSITITNQILTQSYIDQLSNIQLKELKELCEQSKDILSYLDIRV